MSPACLGFPASVRWELSWLLMEETLTRRREKEKEKKEMATFCYLTWRYPSLARTIARRKATPFFRLKHELDQAGVQSRVNLHLLTMNFIVSLTSPRNLWAGVFTWLWKAAGCSSCSKCLGSGDTHAHPRSGKKENLTIIRNPFLGSLVHSGWKRMVTGLGPSVQQEPGGS